jgi:hypothetical protein
MQMRGAHREISRAGSLGRLSQLGLFVTNAPPPHLLDICRDNAVEVEIAADP